MTIKLFLHGVPETAAIWRELVPHIEGDVRTLSLPGFGAPVPDGFEPDPGLWLEAERRSGGRVRRTRNPGEAVQGADVVITDTWTSMGQEPEAEWRRVVFAGYQVNPALMRLADPNAGFMHCLPAHRGEEVVDEVIDGPQSIVLAQAENRLHLQKALLVRLVAETHTPVAPRETAEVGEAVGSAASQAGSPDPTANQVSPCTPGLPASRSPIRSMPRCTIWLNQSGCAYPQPGV